MYLVYGICYYSKPLNLQLLIRTSVWVDRVASIIGVEPHKWLTDPATVIVPEDAIF